ncbi:MAG: GerMN domain-containing protein [Acidobacteriota bacterium]
MSAARPERRNLILWISLAVAAVLVIAAGLWWWLGGGRQGPVEELPLIQEPEPAEPEAFTLFFPGDGGLLGSEERELAVTDEPRGRARTLVLALLDGPRSPGLYRCFPEEVGLLDVYLAPGGVVFVDLGGEAESLQDPPPSGSREEMMRVYSVVETLTANLPEVRRVALLWNGAQRESFAGHLDTSIPLAPKTDLLSPSARRAPAG